MDRFLRTVAEGGDLFDVLVQEDDCDRRGPLRRGFDSYAKMVSKFAKSATEPEPGRGTSELTSIDSPHEFHRFFDRAVTNAWSTRLSLTGTERVGLVPEQSEVSDKVVVFDGCSVAFVLRPIGSDNSTVGGRESAAENIDPVPDGDQMQPLMAALSVSSSDAPELGPVSGEQELQKPQQHYRLVGHAYFCRRDGEQYAYQHANEMVEEITLV